MKFNFQARAMSSALHDLSQVPTILPHTPTYHLRTSHMPYFHISELVLTLFLMPGMSSPLTLCNLSGALLRFFGILDKPQVSFYFLLFYIAESGVSLVSPFVNAGSPASPLPPFPCLPEFHWPPIELSKRLFTFCCGSCSSFLQHWGGISWPRLDIFIPLKR